MANDPVTSDPTSLQRLHDIIVPPLTPWWPPAPGWLWLLAIVAGLLLALVVRGFIRWQKNRYRREALADLKRLLDLEDSAAAQAGMSELLKRTAVTAFPRAEVASLTGRDWFAFLDRTGGTEFSNGLGAGLEQSVYLGSQQAADPALSTEVRRWIQRHRVAA